ncbi:hypothetical protein Ahy_B04g071429 [Arachis hypogaea]|uniref:Uncharacterized protein n=1 Tax=Arachis hypogaea TaxID=3818 RepID=A0A444ZKM8_ARAHY|nr:hypothetical protein Ahy_B04g071429 [Arachis hypogaea]
MKQVKLSVKEAMKPPNGRKIVLRFNKTLQPVGAEAGILSGVLGFLESYYIKFPICEKDWRKVRSKDKIYNECVKEMRNRLYHNYYDSQLTLEKNIEGRPPGITIDHWRWYLDYRNSEETRKNAENRSKQLYTHTGGLKSLAGLEEEEERIVDIEQHDESSRLLSQNDPLAQALEKEHSSRVRGMGLGPTSNQIFASNGAQREETQRVLLELQAELVAKKLKKKAVEDEVAAKKPKRQAVEDEAAAGKINIQAMESVLRCLIQG